VATSVYPSPQQGEAGCYLADVKVAVFLGCQVVQDAPPGDVLHADTRVLAAKTESPQSSQVGVWGGDGEGGREKRSGGESERGIA